MSTFALSGLLRLRQVAEDRAAAELGAAERDRAHADERVRARAERLADSQLPHTADGATWLAAAASRLSLGALLGEDADDALAARALAERRLAEWTRARQAERAVELLQEHHDEREHAAELRAEQIVLDEIAGRPGQEER